MNNVFNNLTNSLSGEFKKYDLVKIWSEFKHVNIKISMDGIGDVYNYIRQDGDWDTVYENMCILNDIEGIDLAAGITVQAHNIYQMPEFYDFWKESPVDLKFITANILQTPNYLSPAVWHGEYRENIISTLRAAESRHPEMDRFATYMENNSKPYMIYARMRKYTRDIENRYPNAATLKSMVKHYLGIKLEGMDIVAENNK